MGNLLATRDIFFVSLDSYEFVACYTFVVVADQTVIFVVVVTRQTVIVLEEGRLMRTFVLLTVTLDRTSYWGLQVAQARTVTEGVRVLPVRVRRDLLHQDSQLHGHTNHDRLVAMSQFVFQNESILAKWKLSRHLDRDFYFRATFGC